MYTTFINWLSSHMLSCPSRRYLHIECPGCGLQRSCIALLHGDLVTSLQLYPATIPIMMVFGFTMFHLKFDFSKGAVILKYLYVFAAIVILTFYIYKIINHKITA